MRCVLLLIPVVVAIYCLNINDAGVGVSVRDVDYGRLLKEAILEIFRSKFLDLTVVVNFVTSVDADSSQIMADKMIIDLMMETARNFSVMIETPDDIKQHWRRKKEFCVFLVDSFGSFQRIFNAMTTKLFKFQGYYIIVLLQAPETRENDIQKIFEDAWTKYMINAVVMSPENGDIHVHTYFPYTRFYCEEVHQYLWNIYRRNIGFIHKRRQIFPDKLKNFHGCKFLVATLENPPFMMSKKNLTGGIVPWGLDGIFLWGLQDILKFKTNIIYSYKQAWSNSTPENVSNTALEMIMYGNANFSIGFFISMSSMNAHFAYSYSYYTTNLVWAIPAGKPLTPIQVFTLPFQKAIWSLLLMTMGISVIVILVINRRSRVVKNFVYGRNIRNPILNMFNVFLGGSMHKLPGRNFARFLLACFIMYSIVIRNAYQGALFHFMRLEDQQQHISSIQDMTARNFSFYTLDSIKDYLEDVKNMASNVKSLNIKEFEDFRYKLNRHKKIALLTSEDHVAYWNKIGFPQDFFKFCPEKASTINLVIYFPKTSCLVNALNQKIFEMTDNGLMDVFRIQTIDKSYLKRKLVIQEPKRLRFRQIEGVKNLLLLGCFVSGIVFCFEVLFGRFCRKNGKKNRMNKKVGPK